MSVPFAASGDLSGLGAGDAGSRVDECIYSQDECGDCSDNDCDTHELSYCTDDDNECGSDANEECDSYVDYDRAFCNASTFNTHKSVEKRALLKRAAEDDTPVDSSSPSELNCTRVLGEPETTTHALCEEPSSDVAFSVGSNCSSQGSDVRAAKVIRVTDASESARTALLDFFDGDEYCVPSLAATVAKPADVCIEEMIGPQTHPKNFRGDDDDCILCSIRDYSQFYDNVGMSKTIAQFKMLMNNTEQNSMEHVKRMLVPVIYNDLHNAGNTFLVDLPESTATSRHASDVTRDAMLGNMYIKDMVQSHMMSHGADKRFLLSELGISLYIASQQKLMGGQPVPSSYLNFLKSLDTNKTSQSTKDW